MSVCQLHKITFTGKNCPGCDQQGIDIRDSEIQSLKSKLAIAVSAIEAALKEYRVREIDWDIRLENALQEIGEK